MAYSTATFQAASIILFIYFKSGEGLYEYLSTKVIAEMLNIPVPTVVKVLNKLSAAGLIQTKEGAKGGVLLAKPISEITLLAIFEAVEQGKTLFKIHNTFNFKYNYLDSIIEKGVSCLSGAETAMKNELKKVTLSDLIK